MTTPLTASLQTSSHLTHTHMDTTLHEHAWLAHAHVDTEPRGQHTFPQWFNFLFAVASCSVVLITSGGSCVWACARHTVDLSRPGVFLTFRDYICCGKDLIRHSRTACIHLYTASHRLQARTPTSVILRLQQQTRAASVTHTHFHRKAAACTLSTSSPVLVFPPL